MWSCCKYKKAYTLQVRCNLFAGTNILSTGARDLSAICIEAYNVQAQVLLLVIAYLAVEILGRDTAFTKGRAVS
jgi:hypothetical protein